MAENCQPISSGCDFRAVYETYHGFVWYALQRLGTATEAVEDAVQDVFVVAYRRRATFEGPSAKAWLYGIARRVASNYRRSGRRRRERVRALRTAQPRTMNEGTREAIETLDRYLVGLTSVDREIFVLAEIEGMTGPEIADVFGRKVQTIYTRIRKLRLGFRAELSDVALIKRDRPQASAGSWAALASVLSESPVLVATGWTAALSSAWVAAGLGAAVATAGLVVADQILPEVSQAQRVSVGFVPAVAWPEQTDAVSAPAVAKLVQESSGALPRSTARDDGSTDRPSARPADPVASPPAKVSPDTNSLAAENELLRRAAAAVRRGGMQEALQLTDAHAHQFSASVLTDLRSAIRIEALCGLGKLAQARGEAALLRLRHPDSPAVVGLEKSCASPQEMAAQPDKQGP